MHIYWANLVEKFEIVRLKYAKFHINVHFFYFRPEIPFLSKFGPKFRNFQFKLKFGIHRPVEE